MAQPTPGDDNEMLSLQAAADLLGVHYMTAYRYVRTGRLDAVRDGAHWYVPRGAIAGLRPAGTPGRNKEGATNRRRDYARELVKHLVAGDEAESWRLVQDALASAVTAEALYLEIIGPALRAVGDDWEAGTISVAEEHRASAAASRLLGRLGPAFTRRGPTRGLVVLGAPTGDRHGLVTELVADPLRGRGFTVADLGADTPAQSFAELVARDDRVRAVGVVVTMPVDDDVVASTIAAVHSARPVPVLLGGRAISDAAHASALGADAFSESAPAAIAWFESIGPTRPRPQPRSRRTNPAP
jgi:excisionase family DNA binding protein